MSIATNVLSWDDDNSGLTDAELNAPFKIDVVPTQPLISQDFYLEIYAHDARRWVTNHYGAGGGAILHFTIENGVSKTEESALNGGSTISVSYPVGSVTRIICNSGLFDADNLNYKVSVGGILPASLYSVINGQIVFDDAANYYGVLTIEYTTTVYKKQHISSLFSGSHYLNCSVPNTSRREIKTIVMGNNEVAVQTVTIRDYCTDEVIPGAVVEVAGQTLTADVNGVVVLNDIDSGQTLPVLITATGYHNSDADTLNNDTITT